MKAQWNFKVNVFAILILAVGIAFFFLFRGNQKKEIQTYVDSIAQHEFVFETWKSEVDSLDIVQQEALEVSAEALKQALARDSIALELIEHYKKLSNVVKIETKFVHDTVNVSVPIYIDGDTTVNLADNCFKASLSFTTGLMTISNLTIDNRQDIAIGDRRAGLFKTKQYVYVRNTNPCITTTGMTSYQIVVQKKWWENPLITVPAGVAIGLVGSQFIK